MPPPQFRRAIRVALLAALVVAPLRLAPGIVGGGPIVEGQLTHTVAVITKGSDSFQGQFCGATIVHPRWALTAATCVEGMSTGGIEIGVGSISLAGVQRIGVADIVIHPEFDRSTLEANLALVLLAEPVPAPVRPILIAHETHLEPGRFGRIAGWGATDVGGSKGSFPDVLHSALAPVVPNEVGNVPEIYDGLLTDRMFIAGYQSGGVGICVADTGGPFIVSGPSGVEMLAGVASFGAPGGGACGGPDGYSGFTKVAAFREWILSHTAPDYLQWESDWGVVGELGDPEGDGRSNFAEFGMVSNPGARDGTPGLRYGLESVGGISYPTVELVRRTDSEGIAFGVEFSENLRDWERFDIEQNLVRRVPLDGGAGETLTVRAPLPVSALGMGRVFFRLWMSASEKVSSVGRVIGTPGYAYSSLGREDLTDGAGVPYKDFRLAGGAPAKAWRAVARSGEFDVELEWLGGDGKPIARSDVDNGGGGDEWMMITPAVGEEQFLRVKASGPDGAGGFSLAIGAPPPALPTAAAGTTDGELETGDEVDPSALPLRFFRDLYLIPSADHDRLIYAYVESDQSAGGFDPFLRITNAETGVRMAENDDIAPGNANSFAVFNAEPRVPYILEASSFEVEATGPYSINLFPLRRISPGAPLPGQLGEGDAVDSAGTYYDSYFLATPPAGTTVTVTVRSDEFDPFAIYFDAGFEELGQDDNSGGGNDALIRFEADGVSSYIIDATSAGAGETGIYVIEVGYSGID